MCFDTPANRRTDKNNAILKILNSKNTGLVHSLVANIENIVFVFLHILYYIFVDIRRCVTVSIKNLMVALMCHPVHIWWMIDGHSVNGGATGDDTRPTQTAITHMRSTKTDGDTRLLNTASITVMWKVRHIQKLFSDIKKKHQSINSIKFHQIDSLNKLVKLASEVVAYFLNRLSMTLCKIFICIINKIIQDVNFLLLCQGFFLNDGTPLRATLAHDALAISNAVLSNS